MKAIEFSKAHGKAENEPIDADTVNSNPRDQSDDGNVDDKPNVQPDYMENGS